MLPRSVRSSAVILVLALLPSVWSPRLALAGREIERDGVLHIDNPAEPLDGVQSLLLTEVWRAGGPDDEALVFGLPTRVRADGQGRVYVLDAQLQQTTVFAPDGEVLGTLFGEGDGPGELRWGCDLILLPGGRVGAVRRHPASLVVVDGDGDPAAGGFGSTTPGDAFAAGEMRGGNLVLAGGYSVEGDQPGAHTDHSLLASYTPDGERRCVYHETERRVDYQHNYVFDEKTALNDFLYSFAVGPDGRVFVLTDRDRYAISVFAPDGRLERVIERAFTPRKRTAREMARIEALTERRFRTFPFDISYVYCENESVVAWYHRGLQVADDGSLWVRHARSAENLPAGVLVRFDVFDAAGHFRRQVDVVAPGDALRDGVFLSGPDHIVVVHGFVDAMRSMVGGGHGPLTEDGHEPGPLEIVCYRITGP